MYSERVSVLRPQRVSSPYSSGTTEDWSRPIVTRVDSPVAVQPRVTTETYNGMGSTVVVSQWVLISPPGVVLDEINASDRIRVEGPDWEGIILEVDGRPGHWRGSVIPHTELVLKLYEGAM